ncbi:MAG TPA: efflux RND transporter periplasmic adaptor subunit [Terracidiphilus sp.]|jgi:HlyD family secretion protein
MSTQLASARPRILRPWQVAAAVAVLAVALGVLYASTRTKAEVRVVNPDYETIESTVSTTGTVVPARDFPARANFTGVVDKIYVHLGEKVKAGQMLIQMKDQYAVPRLEKARADLDDAEVTEQNVLDNGSKEDRLGMQADLQKAQTERDQAVTALDSMEQIAKHGSVSGAELDAANQRVQAAQMNLGVIEKRMTDRYSAQDIKSWKDTVAADKASVAAEKVSWANANISTPIAGTVYVLPTHLYDFVPAGTDMLHVADLSHIQVRANFEEPDMEKIHVGQAVDVTWDGAPGRTWHGHLEAKPLAVTRANGRSVGECLIGLDDDHGDLPLDTNVAVIVATEKREHALSIPREALYTENGKQYVYRVDGDELRRTEVATKMSNAMRIEITGGLTAKDTIVRHVDTDQKLSDGLHIKVVN